MDRLQQLIASRPGARIEARKRLSLHATFRSNVLRFVDDVYAEADPEASVIHWQSASRSGYWDFGVNKKRVEELRRLFNRTS